MDNYQNIGMSILKNLFDFYCEKKLDDEEYIPVVKIIIKGIQESMPASNVPEKEIESLKNRLIEFNRELYKDLWLKHAKEHENPEQLDLDGELDSAAYYFDYIYEYGEHPR
ncbi:MAG: hypothetical protein ISS66_01345 [Desulfobacteraceae bacterium]|nr:hypothetical protein [Desulfobacteraceae bacterium]